MAYGSHAAWITLEEISGIDVDADAYTLLRALKEDGGNFVYPGPEARDISASKDHLEAPAPNETREGGEGRAEHLYRLPIGGLSELLDERISGLGCRVHGCGFQANQNDW